MNTIMTLHPYRHKGVWVFDDPDHGLVKEAFVAGADSIIDQLTFSIEDADNGFVMHFSATPFPGHQVELTRSREEFGGNWYYSKSLNMEGWLCPAMFHYLPKAPEHLFVQCRPRQAV